MASASSRPSKQPNQEAQHQPPHQKRTHQPEKNEPEGRTREESDSHHSISSFTRSAAFSRPSSRLSRTPVFSTSCLTFSRSNSSRFAAKYSNRRFFAFRIRSNIRCFRSSFLRSLSILSASNTFRFSLAFSSK